MYLAQKNKYHNDCIKLINVYQKEIDNYYKIIADELFKESQFYISKLFFYHFIYFVFLANDNTVSNELLNEYKENFIFSSVIYTNYSFLYCRFLELEYRYRNQIQNTLKGGQIYLY